MLWDSIALNTGDRVDLVVFQLKSITPCNQGKLDVHNHKLLVALGYIQIESSLCPIIGTKQLLELAMLVANNMQNMADSCRSLNLRRLGP